MSFGKKKPSRRTRDVLKNFFTERLFVILFLLLQVAIYIILVVRWSTTSQVISVAMTVLSWVVTLVIAGSDRQPSYKVRWIIIVLILPIVGTAIYIILDRDILARRLRRKLNETQARLAEERANDREVLAHFETEERMNKRLARYLSNHAGYPLYEGSKSHFLESGEAFFEALLQDLERAERFIFMEFFIVYDGVMLQSIIDVLERKAAEGVEVRFMYDDVGSLFLLPRKYPEQLEAKGIQCRKFNPLRATVTSILNNRDHRKIVVIDGHIAYTGGLNLADEYINVVERFGHWKDAGIVIEGAAVWSFTQMFLELWETEGPAGEDHRPYVPQLQELDRIEAAAEPGYVQPFGDSPFDSELISDRVFMTLISRATRYIYITTPYLVVDYNMLSALQLAAESGVDVRIITPHKWDKYLVHMTTRTYYEPLIASGVKIYEYTPGFIHSKTVVADDELAVVSTVNFDYRSLYLHFECGVILYGTPSIAEVKQDFIETQQLSQEITPDELPKGFIRKMGGEILRIFAPLM